MAATAAAVDPLFSGTTSKNTRGLLRIIILCTIAAAAISARLFSVIRTLYVLLFVLVPVNELPTDTTYLQVLRVSFTNVRTFNHPRNHLKQMAAPSLGISMSLTPELS
jgi:hypothetical protein